MEREKTVKRNISKELAYWKERFNESLDKARNMIVKTINKIEQEKKIAYEDDFSLPDEQK